MSLHQPFFPHFGSNQVLTAGASSASAVLHRGPKQIRVANTGANKAYIRTYDSTDGAQSATTADYCIQPGTAAVISKIHHNAVAYISATGTTLEIMTGEGW